MPAGIVASKPAKTRRWGIEHGFPPLAAILLPCAVSTRAAQRDLADLTLEQLSKIEITPVSCRTEVGGRSHSEIANVAAIGDRGQPSSTLFYSITAFHPYFSRSRRSGVHCCRREAPRRVSREIDLSLTAQSLFDPRHAERGFAPGVPEFERSVFPKLL